MKRIELPPRGIETLFGVHDQNIKHLESLLDVRVDSRGGELAVDGAPENVATAERILTDFAELFGEGRAFTDKELREAFAQVTEDRNYSLRDYFTKSRFNPAGKKQVAPKTATQRRYIEAIGDHDVVFGIGPAGTGKCIAADSLVLTDRGMIEIGALGADTELEEYAPIDLVIHGRDGAETASHVYNGGEAATLRLTTRFGFQIEATHEHPLLKLDESGALRWTRADELRPGDVLALQRGQRMFGDRLSVDFSDADRHERDYSSKIVRLEKLDEEFAYVMGVLTGDGCLTRTNRVILTSADREVVESFHKLAARFGLHVFKNGADSYDYVIASSQLYKLLMSLGMTNGGANAKRIPSAILHAPERIVQAFLSGLFDADGTIERRDGVVSLSSVSEKLIAETQVVLLNFGIVAAKSIKRGRYRGDVHTSHLLTMTGVEAERFHDLVGFRLQRKSARRTVRTFNTNVDVVPHIGDLLTAAVRSTTLTHAEHKTFGDYRVGRRRPSYAKLAALASVLDARGATEESCAPLHDLLEQRLLFLEVTDIEASRARVFDLTVPGSHSFVANGFVNHNTYLAVAMAVQALMSKQVDRIILARPAVEAGERLGFLPGDLQEKVDPYLRPLYDALFDLIEAERVTKLLEKRTIEIAPLAFMRGRTLAGAFIILDEAQNTTSEQMKMFLTRIGFGSKAVITGDVTQIDLPTGKRSGLIEAERVLSGVEEISFVYFNDRDVVRHKLVQLIVRAYDADKKKES